MPALPKLSCDAPAARVAASRPRTVIGNALLAMPIVLASLSAAVNPAASAPMDVDLTIDPQTSFLTVTAKSLGLTTSPTLSTNTRALGGSIHALLGFGLGNSFPTEVQITISEALAEPHGSFDIVMGQPPAFFIDFDVDGLLLAMETPEPAEMFRVPDTATEYSVDMSQIPFLMESGGVHFVLEGSVDESVALESFDPPLSAAAREGVFGSVTLTERSRNGPFRLFEVNATLPINFKRRMTFAGNVNVDVEFEGRINAGTAVYGSLSGIPGDFNQDLHVLGNDLPIWESGFGTDYDGIDMLNWQRHFGMAPPSIPSIGAVPEPATLCLTAVVCWALLGLRCAATCRS